MPRLRCVRKGLSKRAEVDDPRLGAVAATACPHLRRTLALRGRGEVTSVQSWVVRADGVSPLSSCAAERGEIASCQTKG